MDEVLVVARVFRGKCCWDIPESAAGVFGYELVCLAYLVLLLFGCIIALGLIHRSHASNGIIDVKVVSSIDICQTHLTLRYTVVNFGVSEVAIFASLAIPAFHPETPTLKREFPQLRSEEICSLYFAILLYCFPAKFRVPSVFVRLRWHPTLRRYVCLICVFHPQRRSLSQLSVLGVDGSCFRPLRSAVEVASYIQMISSLAITCTVQGPGTATGERSVNSIRTLGVRISSFSLGLVQ